MKKVKIVGYFMCIYGSSFAQQDAQSLQYMYTTQLFNPAYVGTNENAEISSVYRQQWVGIDGAPKTFFVSANAPLRKGMGVGLNVSQDAIGAMDETQVSVDLAYRLKLTRNLTLSFGLKGGLNMLNIDMQDLSVYNKNESVNGQRLSIVDPVVGAGAFLYSDNAGSRKKNNFYVGLSAPNLVIVGEKDLNVASYKERLQTNLLAGYVFQNANGSIKVKPATILRYVNGAPLSCNVSTNVMFNDKFVAGLGYQFGSNASLFLGTNLQKRWLLGYTYDTNFTALRTFNSGSHEIMLKVKLGPIINGRISSSRFF